MERTKSYKEKTKGSLAKTLERWRSLRHRKAADDNLSKPKSWPRTPEKPRSAPEGCFPVYVGPRRERFMIRTECANHHLFKMLLDEAETEYGYASGGPLELPCDVEFFLGVLWEMDQEMVTSSPGCSCPTGYSGYQLFSPARPVSMGRY